MGMALLKFVGDRAVTDPVMVAKGMVDQARSPMINCHGSGRFDAYTDVMKITKNCMI